MSSELFCDTTRNELFATYNNRCAICLVELPEFDGHCVDILDTEHRPSREGIALGFLEEGYEHNSVDNGMVQCPTCHLAFFEPGHVVLSPAKEVLLWYRNYLATTHYKKRKPLHEIYSMVSKGRYDGLPDVKLMLPFLSLFSVIVPEPLEEDRHRILTCNQPRLSVLRAKGFVPAPPGTSPGAPNVARIFDAAALPPAPTPVALGQIPLSPTSPEAAQRRLWRLPIAFPVVLSAFAFPTRNTYGSEVEEIRLGTEICLYLEVVISGLVERLALPCACA